MINLGLICIEQIAKILSFVSFTLVTRAPIDTEVSSTPVSSTCLFLGQAVLVHSSQCWCHSSVLPGLECNRNEPDKMFTLRSGSFQYCSDYGTHPCYSRCLLLILTLFPAVAHCVDRHTVLVSIVTF
jgi:hypothetical protein